MPLLYTVLSMYVYIHLRYVHFIFIVSVWVGKNCAFRFLFIVMGSLLFGNENQILAYSSNKTLWKIEVRANACILEIIDKRMII